MATLCQRPLSPRRISGELSTNSGHTEKLRMHQVGAHFIGRSKMSFLMHMFLLATLVAAILLWFHPQRSVVQTSSVLAPQTEPPRELEQRFQSFHTSRIRRSRSFVDQSHSSGQSMHSAAQAPSFPTQDQLSVEHYHFPGEVASCTPNASTSGVNLHLFVKCLVLTSGLDAVCSGFGFAESTGGVSIAYQHLLIQPPEVETWEPRIEIRTRRGGVKSTYPMNVSLTPNGRRLRPFHFEGVVPLSLRDQMPELHVDDWPRFHVFRNLDSPEIPAPPTHPPPVFFFMSSFYYEPPRGDYAFAAQLLVHHVRHHVALGFAADVMYVFGHYIRPLLENDELAAYVRSGKLQLVTWDALPKYDDTPETVVLDQQVQFSHALLELWGRNARVLLGDVDEFVVTDKPSNITEVLTCAGWPDQARLTRYDVMCSGEPCPGDGENEAPVWQSPEKHPLRHYSLINRQPWSIRPPKVVVAPGKVRHVFVHEGFVGPGGVDAPVYRECGYMVHPRSMYRKRTNGSDFQAETDWHWPFRN